MLPKLSVIVPSYNQGCFIEETILSIINQGYENLELIVIDGGSTDNSVDVIRRYHEHITYWVSEPDRGQAHAINKGLAVASGEWVAWINSDDCYIQGAFDYIFKEVSYDQYDFLFGNGYNGFDIASANENRHNPNLKSSLRHILRFFYSEYHIIPSQSVFIRRSILKNVGFLNEELHYCMDLDWYCRIFIETNKRFFYDKTICFFRINNSTKTGNQDTNLKMKYEAIEVAENYISYLNWLERYRLSILISYYKYLLKAIMDRKLSSFIFILLRYPFFALNHITFKAYFRLALIK